MGAATRDFRSMIALVLRGAVEGSQMTVVATAERTTIDWCTPEGTVATFTARKRPVPVAAVAPSRQLGLPGVTEAPVPVAAAPPSNAMVGLVAIAGWEPMPPVEVLDASTAVLWTGVTDEGPWRTVVPASVADALMAFSPGCFDLRAPTAPSHLLRVGSLVMWAGTERAVLGLVASDGEDSCGAVLDVDGDPMVAWLDSARVEGGRVLLSPSARYRGVPGDDGWWVAQHHQAPAPVAPVAEDEDAPALYRLWLPARPFGELTDVGREVYEHPDVDTELTWEVRGEHVTAADVPESVAGIVCELAREDGFAFHVGPEAPVAVAPKKAKAPKAPKPAPVHVPDVSLAALEAWRETLADVASLRDLHAAWALAAPSLHATGRADHGRTLASERLTALGYALTIAEVQSVLSGAIDPPLATALDAISEITRHADDEDGDGVVADAVRVLRSISTAAVHSKVTAFRAAIKRAAALEIPDAKARLTAALTPPAAPAAEA